MDVGALWRKGGRGKLGPHWKGSKRKGKLMKGKGRGKWSPFGMEGKGSGKLSPFDPLKGKGKSGSGKWAPTAMKGKGKERPRCWKCGQHGHMSKDCKNVTTVYDETQEEEYEYDEGADWTDCTGAVTYDDWSYGDYCDFYQD